MSTDSIDKLPDMTGLTEEEKNQLVAVMQRAKVSRSRHPIFDSFSFASQTAAELARSGSIRFYFILFYIRDIEHVEFAVFTSHFYFFQVMSYDIGRHEETKHFFIFFKFLDYSLFHQDLGVAFFQFARSLFIIF